MPIEGTWTFEPGCEIYVPDDDDDENGLEEGRDTQELLIFTDDQVEGRVVQYESGNGSCTGVEDIVESVSGKAIYKEIQVTDTCWSGEIPGAPMRQDMTGPMAENPLATWLVFWLGGGRAESQLMYIDDTADPWYLWRFTNDGDDDDENGDNGNGDHGNGDYGNGDYANGDYMNGDHGNGGNGNGENGGNGNGENGDDIELCEFTLDSDEPLIKVSPPVVTVALDIRPFSDTNSVNVSRRGVLPVAVLGSMDFDTTQIDVSTVSFGPAGAVPLNHGFIRDLNADGYMDMLLLFGVKESGIACGDIEATLTGETYGGNLIIGADVVNTVGCN